MDLKEALLACLMIQAGGQSFTVTKQELSKLPEIEIELWYDPDRMEYTVRMVYPAIQGQVEKDGQADTPTAGRPVLGVGRGD